MCENIIFYEETKKRNFGRWTYITHFAQASEDMIRVTKLALDKSFSAKVMKFMMNSFPDPFLCEWRTMNQISVPLQLGCILATELLACNKRLISFVICNCRSTQPSVLPYFPSLPHLLNCWFNPLHCHWLSWGVREGKYEGHWILSARWIHPLPFPQVLNCNRYTQICWTLIPLCC